MKTCESWVKSSGEDDDDEEEGKGERMLLN